MEGEGENTTVNNPEASPAATADAAGAEAKVKDDGERINVKVKDQSGNEVFFRLKKGAPLKKLMATYCSRQGLQPGQIVFLFEGQRVKEDQTPEELEMEDGDEIDAMMKQTGGR